MNDRLQALKQRSAASHQSVQATLQKTAPKATLGGIKAAAEKKFGQRKPRKKQQPKPKQPKKQINQQPKQPKKQINQQPKAVRSDMLDQWTKAMEKSNIPEKKWKSLEDKISKLSGADRKEIEEILFEHPLFAAVYDPRESDASFDDDYLSDLEDKINELTNDNNDNNSLNELIDDVVRLNPDSTLSAAVIKGAITKPELTTALANISKDTKVAPDQILKFGIYSTDDITTQGIDAEPIMDFELSANAIQNRYGIDVRTPEGQEKFEDLVVFEAIDAAAKQNVKIAADPKKLETLNNMGKDRLNDFEQITGTNIIQYLDNTDDAKLD